MDKIEIRDEAEKKRSSEEARRCKSENLARPQNVARYMSPPQDTVEPSEYPYFLLGDVRNKTVLDLGCGAGENTVILTRRGAKVVGLDISQDLVEIAQGRAQVHGQTAQFIVTSAHAIGLAGKSVDVVFGEAILHHLDLECAANEIRRILRPGGYAIFKEPIRDSAILRGFRRLIPYQRPDISPYEYPLTQKRLEDFVRGFELSAIRRFGLPFTQLAALFGWSDRFLLKVDRWLLTAVPWIGHFASIIVFRMDTKTLSPQQP